MNKVGMSEDFRVAVRALATIQGTRGAAKTLGVSSATVSRIVNGKPIDLNTARALFGELGTCPCCGSRKGRPALNKEKSHD